MDLDLNVRTQGRPPRPVLAEVVRELTPEDLAAVDKAVGSTAAPIKAIRASHHRLARALAEGMKPGEAAYACGYSLSRVSILQADSTFQELIEHYRGPVTEAFRDRVEQMGAAFDDALEIVVEKLHDDDVKLEQALEVVTKMADRIGHGPQKQSAQVNVNVDISARLDRARLRAGLDRPQVLDLPAVITEEPGA